MTDFSDEQRKRAQQAIEDQRKILELQRKLSDRRMQHLDDAREASNKRWDD